MEKITFSRLTSDFFKKNGVFIYPTSLSISSEVFSKIENLVREFGGNVDHYRIRTSHHIIPVYYFPTEEEFTWFKKSIELEFDEK